jgi:heterodisulfide reductase subunit A
MYLAKQAHLVKERLPNAKVTVYYMDVRAFGKGFEEFYDRVKEEGVFYRRGNPSEVYKQGDRLVVRVEDTLLGEMVEHETDMVVLGTGLVASESTKELAKILKMSLSADRFLLEAHPKLRPVDSTIDGVFLAGCCQGPKDIPDTVAQAKGAASAAIGILASGRVKVEPAIANVDADRCTGCHVCQSLCPYTALEFNDEKKVMAVNEVLCKGCGVCPSACPVGAIKMRHSTGEQIEAQIEALLEAKSE